MESALILKVQRKIGPGENYIIVMRKNNSKNNVNKNTNYQYQYQIGIGIGNIDKFSSATRSSNLFILFFYLLDTNTNLVLVFGIWY
jgi:hypothetical protein